VHVRRSLASSLTLSLGRPVRVFLFEGGFSLSSSLGGWFLPRLLPEPFFSCTENGSPGPFGSVTSCEPLSCWQMQTRAGQFRARLKS
jgi:hypothetical protein